jgi:hypothetical protein
LTTNRSLEIERLDQKESTWLAPAVQRHKFLSSTTVIRPSENGYLHSCYNETTFQLGIGVLVVRRTLTTSGVNLSSLKEASVQFRFADWFLRWAIKIVIGREFGNFKITIRPYRLVPAASAIFQACALGDDQAVARLIREGKASPFDMTSKGITPLHVRRRNFTVLSEFYLLLLDHGWWLTCLIFRFRWPPLGFIRLPASSFWITAQMVRFQSNITTSFGMPRIKESPTNDLLTENV